MFQTANDVLVFSATGTGAMESAVANLVTLDLSVLACAAGKFGERWIELCRSYGADVKCYEPGWGQRLDPAEISTLLEQNPQVEVVFATLSETSTGVVHDVEAIARVARDHGAILVVDAISGVGAVELRQDEWGVDVVVGGSQKALMCPPGLAFVSASQRALDYAARRSSSTYYFDWLATVKKQRQQSPDSPFTPAVGLVRALDVALTMILDEGLDIVLSRHRLLAQAARSGADALGLPLFGDPDDRATAVTAIELPDTVDGAKVPGMFRDLGVTVNGGQGELEGRILRLAHCGYFGPFDLIITLSALEMVLSRLGHPVELGVGVAAAQRVFLNTSVGATVLR